MPNTNNLKISEDVIAVVANVAARETDGVSDMVNTNISGVFAKDNTKGIKATVIDNSVVIDVHVIVDMGRKILEVAENVQQKVHEEVETMTGLDAIVVNVFVDDVDAKALKE